MRGREQGGEQSYEEAMRQLAVIAEFASVWHRGVWSISALPRLLDVPVRWVDADPDCLGIAGADAEDRGICLNRLIEMTPAEIPVLAHEIGHLMTGTPGPAFCTSRWAEFRGERHSWLTAALLLVPRQTAIDVCAHHESQNAEAVRLGVPSCLVGLRIALAGQLGEVAMPSHLAATCKRGAFASLTAWLQFMVWHLQATQSPRQHAVG